jgi:hypothetical protein
MGDYLLQNDFMAGGKKRSTPICALHCAIWTWSVCFFAGLGWLPATILFVEHFIQDRGRLVEGYMRWMRQNYFLTNMQPWSVIVVDNTWHLVTIYLVLRFVPNW